jgi:hypothetical protein
MYRRLFVHNYLLKEMNMLKYIYPLLEFVQGYVPPLGAYNEM